MMGASSGNVVYKNRSSGGMAILATRAHRRRDKSTATADLGVAAAVSRAEWEAVRARVDRLEALLGERATAVGAVTLNEIAAGLGVSRWTVRRRLSELRRLGLVELVPVARARRFDRASFERVRIGWEA